MLSKQITTALLAVTAGSGLALAAANAQPPATPATTTGQMAPAKTGRENLARLNNKSITVDMKEWKLEDVIKHITAETDCTFEPVWKSGNEDGLDPEMLITYSAKGLDGLTLLEKILEKASGEAITSDDKATWQLTSYGAIQIGPRKALNKSKRLEVYDVADLLFEVPVYDEVPTIDLSQVLQNSGGKGGGGGGGSGSNLFGGAGGKGAGNQQRQEDRRKRREELVTALKQLLTSLAEKDQWEDNGGSGGTMTAVAGNLIIDAPDYMHRAVAGYPWLPSTRPNAVKSRRYVSMSGNVEAAKLIGLTPFTETGAAR